MVANYLGTILQVIGAMLFASTFVTFVVYFGDYTNFEARARSEMVRALLGAAFLVGGGVNSYITNART